jgi:hypothetical protein
MALVEVNWNPSRRELKQFAALWCGFFALIAAYCVWHGLRGVAAALTLLVVFGVVSYFRPNAIRFVYVLWMAIALPIGWTISHLVLLMLYYLIFTPIGLIMRLVGYDPLERSFDNTAKSYWVPHNTTTDTSQYFKQY